MHHISPYFPSLFSLIGLYYVYFHCESPDERVLYRRSRWLVLRENQWKRSQRGTVHKLPAPSTGTGGQLLCYRSLWSVHFICQLTDHSTVSFWFAHMSTSVVNIIVVLVHCTILFITILLLLLLLLYHCCCCCCCYLSAHCIYFVFFQNFWRSVKQTSCCLTMWFTLMLGITTCHSVSCNK